MKRRGFYLLLALLVLAGFWPAVTGEAVLNGTWDRPGYELPLHVFGVRAAHRLEIPQWNPYYYCGTSYWAGSGNRFLYPLNWPLYALAEAQQERALTWALLAHVYAAGVFAFWLYRRIAGNAFWGGIAALTYLGSAPLVMNMVYGHTSFQNFTWLPLWLYLLHSHRSRSTLRNLIYQALTAGMVLLGGMLQTSFYLILLAVGYAAYLQLLARHERSGSRWQPLPVTLGALVLAGVWSAGRWLPFILTMRGDDMPYTMLLRQCWLEGFELVRLLFPGILGTDFSDYHGGMNFIESMPAYLGWLPLSLALYAAVRIPGKKTWFWSGALVGILLAAYGTPVTGLLHLLGNRSSLMFTRITWFMPVCWAALCACAGSRLERRPAAGAGMAGGALLLLLPATLLLLLVRQRNGIPLPGDALAIGGTVAVLSSLLLLRWSRQPASRRTWLRGAIGLLVIADLSCSVRIHANALLPFFSPPPVVSLGAGDWMALETYREEGGRHRIYGRSRATQNATGLLTGMYASTGYDNRVPEGMAALMFYPASPYRLENGPEEPTEERLPQFCRLTATRWIVYPDTVVVVAAPLARASLFAEYRVVPEPQAQLPLLLAPDFDPARTLLLTETPPLPPASGMTGTARIIADEPDRVSIATVTDAPGLLLLADLLADGWEVRVNDQPAALLRANYAFRAVAVPVGHANVVFRFRQPGLAPGLVLSGVATLVLLFLLLRLRWQRTISG